MKNLHILGTAVLLTALISSTDAYARKAMAYGANCSMVETATMGVNFNNIPIELKTSGGFMKQKSEEIVNIAADLGIQTMDIQNFNYSIYSNNGGGCNAGGGQYFLNGNVSYTLENTEQASALMQALNEKGYQVNFNMNAYRQCQ